MTAEISLFQRKAINQISHTNFCPTIFNLETILCVRLVFHNRYLSALRTMQNLFSLCSWFSAKHLTVCVTCAGAGTAKPSNWKNAKAWKTA